MLKKILLLPAVLAALLSSALIKSPESRNYPVYLPRVLSQPVGPASLSEAEVVPATSESIFAPALAPQKAAVQEAALESAAVEAALQDTAIESPAAQEVAAVQEAVAEAVELVVEQLAAVDQPAAPELSVDQPAAVEQPAVQEPVQAPVIEAPASDEPAVPPEFLVTVMNGNPNELVGVYVEGRLALPVMQQPDGQAAYVSERAGIITQFGPASHYGTVGLLAHNYLSGQQFFNLQAGDTAVLVYGDGSLVGYRITSAQSYQALTPTSTYSDFVDQADPSGPRLSSTDVFRRVYMQDGRVVFQTCIEANGNPSWGRLFVIGERVN